MGRTAVRSRILTALALVTAGVVVLALSDRMEGRRLVEFGPGHGPSTLDLLGIAVLAPGAT